MTKNFLDKEIVDALNDLWDEHESELKVTTHQNVNNVKFLFLEKNTDANLLEANQILYEFLNNKHMKPVKTYMLEYYKDSWTKPHIDISDKTQVTLIHKSDDLVGGYTFKKDEDGSITVIDQEVSEVLEYDQSFKHGVSKVLSGTRRVLINWYKGKY